MKNFCEDLFFFFFFFGDRLKNFCEDLFFFFFGEHLRFVSLVLGLGLEHSCPWPRECLSSKRLSLALASDFFCVLGLGLEPCVLDSTSTEQSRCFYVTRTVHCCNKCVRSHLPKLLASLCFLLQHRLCICNICAFEQN